MIVTRRKRRPRVEIPIDVIFILVFHALASFEIKSKGLKVELPKAVTASEREPATDDRY